MLRIELIGNPTFKPVGKLAKKAKALLIYLALKRNAVSREKLADLLWPHQQSEQARHSLRNCLLEVRKTVGQTFLLADFANVRLQDYTLDTDEFFYHCASGDAVRAAALIRGEFLADFYIASEPWQEWMQAERDHWTASARDAFLKLSSEFSIAGNHKEAMACGQRAIALDGLHEHSYQIYMLAAEAASLSGDAMRAYFTLCKTMKDELGVGPDEDTRALAKRIRGGAPPDSLPVAKTLPGPPPAIRAQPAPITSDNDIYTLRQRKHAIEDLWQTVVAAMDAKLKPQIAPSLIRETYAVLKQDREGLYRAAA